SGVAAGLVAIDPLLVRYASQPMTESLCTLLVTAWLLALLTCLERSTVARGWWCGVLIGLCGLCRPTIWSTAGLVGVWFLWRAWRRRTERSDSGAAEVRLAGSDLRPVLAGLAGTLLVIAPWVVRNMVVFGRPILTTTHGGYTLLLGNNPSFYGEVVRQEWGAVWDGSHGQGQTGWVEGLQTEMQLEGIVGEVAQDQWMNDRGWNNIRADLGGFLQAAMLRLVRFWNVLPMGDARSGWSGRVLTSIACFYSAQWLLMFAGVVDAVRRRVVAYGPALLLLLSFTAVHLVYWSNVRMRAPLVPVLAILAVHGAEVIRRKFRRVNGVANPASSA
ncbi:MAG: hypothetical protein KDA75_08155, partial [Planctomycetaceae bacterium]|nr:hypothetical protein [Planctomycetaceae bacterium]